MEIKWKIILRIITLIFFILGFFFLKEPFMDVINKRRNEDDKMYPYIVGLPREFKGKIIRRFLNLNWAGTYSFELSNGDKFSLSTGTWNDDYGRRGGLLHHLSVGDSIYKPVNNDSLYLYRKNEKQYYVLGKIINKKRPDYRKYFHKKE
ncbi:hypothetical protein [Viscerimonas tarda]